MTDEKTKVGVVTHYYTHLMVGIVKFKKDVKLGDRVLFLGHTTNFEQELDDIELDHKKVDEVKKGDEVGVKVDEKVREGDEVFLV